VPKPVTELVAHGVSEYMARGKKNRKKGNGKLQNEIKKIAKAEHRALPAAVDNIISSRPARMGIPGRNGGKRGKRKRRGGGGMRGKFAGGERVTLSGREYLAAVNVTSTQQIGDTLFSGIVSPGAINGSRLQIFSGLYERWKLKRWVVTYIPEVGTSTPGNLVLYYEPDPTDFVPDGQAAISKAMSSKGIDFPVYSMSRPKIGAKVEKEFTNLYTTDSVEVRMSQAGLMVLFCNFVSTFSGTTTVGQLVLDYEIEFFKPLLELNTGAFSTSQVTVQITSPTFNTMFGTGFVEQGEATIDLTRISGSVITFQPRSAGDVYLFMMRGTSTATLAAPNIVITNASGKGVAANYSEYAATSTVWIYLVNMTALDNSLITITQGQSTSNNPATSFLNIIRVNSTLTRKKKTKVETKIDQIEQLLYKLLSEKDSSYVLQDTTIAPVPVEELIKKYLSDKK